MRDFWRRNFSVLSSVQIVMGHAGPDDCPFKLQELFDARPIEGYRYRERWPNILWQLKWADDKSIPGLLAIWHENLCWATGTGFDNHQTFLLEVKYYVGGNFQYMPLYVMFHDGCVWMGQYIHRTNG